MGRLFLQSVTIVCTILILIHIVFWQGYSSIFLIICNLICIAIAAILSMSKNLILNPLFFLFLTLIVSVLLRSYFLVYSHNEDVVNYLRLDENVSYFIWPSIVLFLGLLAFMLGFTLFQPKKASHVHGFGSSMWVEWKVNLLISLLFAVSFISLIIFLRYSGINGLESLLQNISKKRYFSVEGSEWATSLGYLRLLISLGEMAFYILIIDLFQYKRKFSLPRMISIMGLGFINIFYPLFTSSRSSLLLFFLNLFIILVLYNRLNLKLFAIGIVSSFFLIIAITSLRAKAEANYTLFSFIEKLAVNRNMLCVSKTAHIINGVPSKIDYKYGSTMVSWVYAPIPRVIWPQKPNVSVGKEVGSAIFDTKRNSYSGGAGVPPGIIAELFINFGTTGVLVLMGIFGIMYKSLFFQFPLIVNSAMNPNNVLFYLLLMLNLAYVFFGGSFSQTVIDFLTKIVPAVIFVQFISRKGTYTKLVY